MAIKKNTLDDLLAGRDPQAVFSKDGLFDELKKALAERVLNAEIDDDLDGEAAAGKRNSRNGTVRNLVCEAILTLMEGGYGDQEDHTGRFAGWA